MHSTRIFGDQWSKDGDETDGPSEVRARVGLFTLLALGDESSDEVAAISLHSFLDCSTACHSLVSCL